MSKPLINKIDEPITPDASKTKDLYATASKHTEKMIHEKEEAHHKVVLMMYKVLPPVIIIFGILFLFALFFVIMPFSAMELDADGWQEWLRDYSNAFISRLGNFGITVVAIIISEILKTLFRLIRNKNTE